jgi:N-acetylneuraminate lyase
MGTPFEGILPAVVTLFDGGYSFDAGVFESLLEALNRSGVHRVYAGGQAGEGMRRSVAQRKRVAEIAVRISPPEKLVIVHVGAYYIADAVELARHAERIGATAISRLPPLNQGTPGIYNHCRLRATSTDLPLLLYYFPEANRKIAAPDLLPQLLEIPNVAGVKFTDFNLYQLWQRELAVFNGRDEVLAAGFLMGANGGIGTFYNLIPSLFVRIWELTRAGRWEEAACVKGTVNELITITLGFPVFSAVKTMPRLDCGPCNPFYGQLTTEQETDLHSLLSRSAFANYSFAGAGVR